jgi:glycosyltransferase involved in cell wall biosynthesis
MACGRPVIAVDRHGPAEVVDHGRTGWLVQPDDPAGLANALVEAVNRPAERRRRGAEAREDALARFAWPALAAEVAEVYAQAAGEVADGQALART